MPGGYSAPNPAPRSAPASRPPQTTDLAAAPAKPKTVRAQMDDELAPPAPPPRRSSETRAVPLMMPPPEQLGVGGTRKVENAVDWDLVHRRFHEAGATCFQLDNRPQGGCRLICLLPTANPDRTHRIETEAATEAEVARLALERLEEWTRKK
jgi:hypothetical protein